MGANFAEDLATSELPLEDQLAYHLRANHYPPIPAIMVGTCIAAIDAVNDYDPYREIELPDGVSYRGSDAAPAYAIVEQHHLNAWLDYEDQ
jgi:hypothetical protein